MISSQTITLVQATVPLLRAQGESITRHFYQLLFRNHPEVRGFFNESHQAAGTQARALAGAVLAFAEHIERLDALAGMLPRIVQKHAALGVRPEHYPVVGGCLLQAIREVLGEELATEPVIAAWAEAYQALAGMLIAAEEAVYQANEARPGGWRGTRQLRIVQRVQESEEITSFHLAPVDGGRLPDFMPGQYLTLVLDIDGQQLRRHYSLSAAPGQAHWRISVKREPGGRASNWLHDHAVVGTELAVQAPGGDFVLDTQAPVQRPLVLVTGGVGITPAVCMLEAVAASGRPIRFVHAARHGGVHAFRERVRELAARHPQVQTLFVYDQPRPGDQPDAQGRLTAELLARQLPADRDVDLYFIGPKPFMQAVYTMGRALGVPAERLRYEFFGPQEALQAA